MGGSSRSPGIGGRGIQGIGELVLLLRRGWVRRGPQASAAEAIFARSLLAAALSGRLLKLMRRMSLSSEEGMHPVGCVRLLYLLR